MAPFYDYHPPVNSLYYELWEEGGDLIVKIPVIAQFWQPGDIIFLDEVEYEIEGFEYHLTSLDDFPGSPQEPPRDTGFGYVLVKVYASLVV